MITSVLNTKPNDIWRMYYWDGANEPVDLLIEKSLTMRMWVPTIENVTLAIVNQRVYVLTECKSVMLYDSTIPGDANNILTRIRSFGDLWIKTMIVNTVSTKPNKMHVHDNGACIWHEYNHMHSRTSIVTTINGADIEHKSIIDHYNVIGFNKTYDTTFSDTFTYDNWHFTRVQTITKAMFNMVLIDKRSRSYIISETTETGQLTPVGICNGLSIIRAKRTCTSDYFIIPMDNMESRIKVLSDIEHIIEEQIHGHLVYVLARYLCGDITTCKMYLIDMRNAFTYEFTYIHTPQK